MEIIHRISINSRKDSELFETVKSLDIVHQTVELPGGMSQLISFEITESSSKWTSIKDLIGQSDVPDVVQTSFTEDEILSSEIVRLIITYTEGYPQPKSTWVSTKPNYEVLCSRCGLFRQKEPFSIQSEPKLGDNKFMTLIWGSVVFVVKEVVQRLSEKSITGYQPWEVWLHDSGRSSEKIQQFYFSGQTAPGMMDGEAVDYEDCVECGERKYFAHTRGAMKYRRSSFPDGIDMLQSHEWFGAGGRSAYKEVFIRNRLARMILENGWKGAQMKVVELVD